MNFYTLSHIYEDKDRTIEILGKKFPWPFPIAYGLHGSSARVFGRAVYGNKSERKFIKFFHRTFRTISDWKYAFKYRFVKTHRYNVIYTDLEPGYYDHDMRILHGVMKCLCDYVEEMGGVEKMEEGIKELQQDPDPNAPEGLCFSQAKRESEALAIYKWWTIERPADEKRHRELQHEAYKDDEIEWKETEHPNLSEMIVNEAPGETKAQLRKSARELENKIDEDDQAYLLRVIAIRRGLWT